MTRVIKICLICGIKFSTYYSTGKFCSKKCAIEYWNKEIGPKYRKVFKKGNIPWNKGLKGIHLSLRTEFKKGNPAPKTAFKKGYIPWHKGKKCPQLSLAKIGHKVSKETREKISEKNKGNIAWNKDKIGIQRVSHKTREKLRNSRIRYIEYSKNNGFPISPTVGKYEKLMLDKLEYYFGYKILRQHRVVGYFLDGYCPILNLTIEVDEERHNQIKQIKKDKYRETQIKKELACSFLRIPLRGD